MLSYGLSRVVKITDRTRFALFSDTHVAEGTTGAADLRLAVADVNTQTDINFVLVSGDITDLNIGNNLRLAKQILDSLEIPYYIIPGNHDTKWSGSAGANFRALWEDDKFVFDHGGYRFIGFHQGPVLRMDDGHIPSEILFWLRKQLIQTGSHMPVILVMHYPLSPAVDNWHECVDIIQDYNIKAIIHGHGHRNRLLNYQGIPGIMGRSILRARSERGGYSIFSLDKDSLRAFTKIIGESIVTKWTSVSLNKNINIASVPDSLLPDNLINKKYPFVNVDWVFNSGNMMTASPVSDENQIYIGDVSGSFYALDTESGDIVWSFQGAGAIYGTAAVYQNKLVFTSADSVIYCLNSDDGSIIWKYKTGDALVSVPLIADEVVYVGASDGVFRALDMRHGELIWEYKKVGSYVETRPLLYQNKVIFGAWDGRLYALNQLSGHLEWLWIGEKTNPLYSPAACWPVAAAGMAFITAPDRFLTAIDTKTGKTIWRNNRWKFRETIGLSGDGNTVYGRSMTDSVVAFQSQYTSPVTKWAEDFAYGYDIAPSMPVEKEGTLFWGTKMDSYLRLKRKTDP